LRVSFSPSSQGFASPENMVITTILGARAGACAEARPGTAMKASPAIADPILHPI
jgi:hypothetical protein